MEIDHEISSESSKQIQIKIKDNVYKLIENKRKTKSSVWKIFRFIQNENGCDIKNFVCCQQCKNVYPYNHRIGTSNLSKHKCVKHLQNGSLNNGQRSISDFCTVPNNLKQKFSEDLRKDLNKSCASFVVLDMRPMYAMEGNGLANLLSTFTNIGQKYGCLSPDICSEILPHPTNVTRNILKMAGELVPNLAHFLSPIYLNIGGAVTLDVWTDDHIKRSYLGLTVHFIDKDFSLYDRVIETYHLPVDIPKTGINLKCDIMKILRKYKIFEAINTSPKRIVFVTDRGSNIKCGLKDEDRLDCFAHLINNLTQNSCQEINYHGGVLENCRNLVSYCKRISLNQKFKNGTLKMSVDTRWHTVHDMLESISNNWDQIADELDQKNASEKLNDLDKDVIDAIISFLEPLKMATKEVESTLRPSLYLVQLWVVFIKNHLIIKDSDPEFIIQMKEAANPYFDNNLLISVTKYHQFAVYLHPLFKSLKCFSSDQRASITQNVS